MILCLKMCSFVRTFIVLHPPLSDMLGDLLDCIVTVQFAFVLLQALSSPLQSFSSSFGSGLRFVSVSGSSRWGPPLHRDVSRVSDDSQRRFTSQKKAVFERIHLSLVSSS